MDPFEKFETTFKINALEKFKNEQLDKAIRLEIENDTLRKKLEELLGKDPAEIKALQDAVGRATTYMEKLITIYDSKSSDIKKQIEEKLTELEAVSDNINKAKEIYNSIHGPIVSIMSDAIESVEKKKQHKTVFVSFLIGVISSLAATLFYNLVTEDDMSATSETPTQQVVSPDAEKSRAGEP